MKDLTPVFTDKGRLQEKSRLGLGHDRPNEGEKASLLTEKEVQRKRELYEQCLPVAHDILEEARAALAVRFRFLDRALWRMPLQPEFDVYGIASDGVKVHYDPVYVVTRFKLSPNEVVRDVAHCLFHCIFRHPFMIYTVWRQAWDVACDVAIETLLLDLLGKDFPCNMDRREREALKVLTAKVDGVVTAERLYYLFSNEGNKIDLVSLRPIFYRDAHGYWYNEGDEGNNRSSTGAARQTTEDKEGGSLPEQQGSESIDEERDDMRMQINADAGGEGDSSQDTDSERNDDAADETANTNEEGDEDYTPSEEKVRQNEELADQWKELSQNMQVDLETALTKQGLEPGNLVAALRAVNREQYDYADFLKRFATLHERMRINQDEFDYIYYIYGLDHYGNMPLIEPLEYREDRSVRDFAIVIDTSESVSGDLVQGFICKTYNILKQQDSFQDRVNIHIIQCDARVQDDTKITSLDQLDAYLDTMELRGFGGTDFRPAFEYVNLLVEKHEFTDLRGLIYFTDGEGTFPRRKPAYDAVFVFLDEGYNDPPVPPWAYKVLLSQREMVELQEGRARLGTG